MKRGFFGKGKHKLFGVDLAEIMARPEEKGKKCPSLMEECFTVLQENSNLDVEGIFRQSASTVELEKLMKLYNSSKQKKEERLKELRAASPIGVACLVKQFLRELPEPLFTKSLSPLFISAGRTEDPKERFANLRLLLQGLPALNRRILRELITFLHLVIQHSEKNRMTVTNLGIVFAPTLIYTDLSTPDSNALADAGIANDVVSDLIKCYDELLPGDSRPATPFGTPLKTPVGTPGSGVKPERKKSRPSTDQTTSALGTTQSIELPEELAKEYDDGTVQPEDGEYVEEEEEEEDSGPTKEMLQAYLTGIQEWEAKKEKIKQDLIAYDAAFAREHGGRLPTPQEKLPMKEKYEQYKNAKIAIEKLKAEYEKGLATSKDASADDILPLPYCRQSRSELSKSLSKLMTEKRNLRHILSKWSHEFAANNGRPPKDVIDYEPVQDTFNQYGRLKETIDMITKYLETHSGSQD